MTTQMLTADELDRITAAAAPDYYDRARYALVIERADGTTERYDELTAADIWAYRGDAYDHAVAAFTDLAANDGCYYAAA